MSLLLFVSFIIAIVPERKCFHCGYKNDVLGALITVLNTLLQYCCQFYKPIRMSTYLNIQSVTKPQGYLTSFILTTRVVEKNR